MPKFPFKRPRIIAKKFPQVNSTIDSVTKSLDDLVFAYNENIEKTVQKKHIMLAISSMVLLVVLGSFITPKGKADSSIFYPESCLGGWLLPHLAQGELTTTSNGDNSQFNNKNSAILPKNTNGEIYCGNFKGKFDENTKPVKIMVSLALTDKDELLENVVEEIKEVSSSSLISIDAISSTTQATTSSTTSYLLDNVLIVSTSSVSSTTEQSSTTLIDSQTESFSKTEIATATKNNIVEDGSSFVSSVVESVVEGVKNLLNTGNENNSQTDTVIIETNKQTETETTEIEVTQPVSQIEQTQSVQQETVPQTEESHPVSFINRLFDTSLLSFNLSRVFAEEVTETSGNVLVVEEIKTEVNTENQSQTSVKEENQLSEENTIVEEKSKEEIITNAVESTSTKENTIEDVKVENVLLEGTTTSSTNIITDIINNLATSTSSSTEIFDQSQSTTTSSTTNEVIIKDDNVTIDQNNFLEIFYTFDGVNWISLGELNEISMKYRTFEIPVNSSTSWNDLSSLQIKVVAIKKEKDTPYIFLDGIKVEVLYENVISHSHPDFGRDTILKDEIAGNVRMVTLINYETKEEEIWYMYIDDLSKVSPALEISSSSYDILSATTSTSSLVTATTSKEEFLDNSTSTNNSSTTENGSSTKKEPVVDLLKKVWKKYEGNKRGVSIEILVEDIKKENKEEIEKEKENQREPDFNIDTLKKIKGIFMNNVIVLVSKKSKDELWFYNLTNSRFNKLDTGSSSLSLSKDFPIGIKDKYLFWLSEDNKKVYAYDLENKTIKEKEVPFFDSTKGERGEVVFDDILWKVIIGENDFSFFSQETGEVFSDDNLSFVEEFRKKNNLDDLLKEEEISNLNLPVEKKEDILDN